MKIAVVGSRDYPQLWAVDAIVSRFGESVEIVSGGALGVDTMAEVAADKAGLKTHIFKPEWEKLGKRAGYVRNVDIIYAADLVLAFWDGESRGTGHSIRLAYATRKPLVVFDKRAEILASNLIASLEGEVVTEVTQQSDIGLLDWLKGILAHQPLHLLAGKTVPNSQRSPLQ